MAITWDWKEKCGEATFLMKVGEDKDKTYDVDLYVGNCFLIMIREFTEDGVEKYALETFFADDGHMERCLKDDIFDTGWSRLTKIRINKAKCRNYEKIVELLVKYTEDITIEVYKEGNYTWHEFKPPRKPVSDELIRQIAETAVPYLEENDILEDYLEEFDIELDRTQRDYFGI